MIVRCGLGVTVPHAPANPRSASHQIVRSPLCAITSVATTLETEGVLTSWVNAGHEAPVVGGPSRNPAERLEPTGPALGMMPDMTFRARQTVLAPGETLFAFTDGVTDSKDPAGRFFTEERLLELVSKGATSAKALLEAVETAIAAHAAGSEPSDDITMLAVRRDRLSG